MNTQPHRQRIEKVLNDPKKVVKIYLDHLKLKQMGIDLERRLPNRPDDHDVLDAPVLLHPPPLGPSERGFHEPDLDPVVQRGGRQPKEVADLARSKSSCRHHKIQSLELDARKRYDARVRTLVDVLEEAPPPGVTQPASGLSVVLCGSFRRDAAGLRRTFARLRERFVVVSPVSVDFENPGADFVRLPSEIGVSVGEIEERHLAAMRQADFVWLFCPEGHVGTSAALEVGYAHAAGIPVFTDVAPLDDVVAGMVAVVGAIDDCHRLLEPNPGRGLATLQDYYRRIGRVGPGGPKRDRVVARRPILHRLGRPRAGRRPAVLGAPGERSRR